MTLPKTDYSPEGCAWLRAQLSTMLDTAKAAQKDAYNDGNDHALDCHNDAAQALRTAINSLRIAENALRKVHK